MKVVEAGRYCVVRLRLRIEQHLDRLIGRLSEFANLLEYLLLAAKAPVATK